MKKYFIITLLLLQHLYTFACPACEKQQPKILKGITHGTGPDSQWDYVIVWIMVAVVLITLFYSVKWLISPKEKANSHIKNFILNNE
ncbi:hypothetical protein BH09BAC1_BH09BAC1_18610 [soil metagenome]